MSQAPTVDTALYSGRTHPKMLVRPFVIQLLLVGLHVLIYRYVPTFGFVTFDKWFPLVLHGMVFLAGLHYAIVPTLRWWNARFEITDRDIRERWGVLHKNTREITLDRITQINEERGLLDRIFGCGTLVVYDAANASAIRFHDVPRFKTVRSTLDEARRAAQTRALNQTLPSHDAT